MYKIDGTTFKRTTKAGSATKSASVEYVVKNPTIFFFAGPATSRDWFCSGASLTGKGPESRGYYLWGNPEGYNYKSAAKPVPVKTIYDPCPVGYMVPPADFYSALAIKSRHSYCGKVCTTGGGTTTWFPSNSAIQAKNDAKDSDGNAAYNRWINDDMAYLWMSSFTSASSTQTWHCKLGSQVTSHNALYNAYGFGVRCIQELR